MRFPDRVVPVLLFVLPLLTVTLAPRVAGAADGSHAHHGAAPMTDADMKKWIDDFYATHPQVGSNRTAGLPAATVTVVSFRFEADGNAGTQVDTVKIQVGDAVQWVWGSGSHTITSGTGGSDPQAGSLFDVGIFSSNTGLVYQFDDAGLFPYFCRPHEFFAMKGYVLVQSNTGVTPLPDQRAALGFTRAPRPNPTRNRVDFQFALDVAGPARIDVYDTRGARIATVTDGELPAGAYSARWDGTGADGRAVGSGVYYLRMTLPGYAQSRRVVIAR